MTLTIEEAVQRALQIPGFTTGGELRILASLARQVPHGAVIVEVGAMQGRSTLAMALATEALVVAIDNSAEETVLEWHQHLSRCPNVLFWHNDSRQAVKYWRLPIQFLFVDGGHDYETARSDIFGFGICTQQVIAIHDYSDDVELASAEWLAAHPEWRMAKGYGSLRVFHKGKLEEAG